MKRYLNRKISDIRGTVTPRGNIQKIDHGPQLPTDGKEPYLNACLPSLLSSRAPFLEVGKFLNRQLLQDYSSLLIYNSILRMKQEGH